MAARVKYWRSEAGDFIPFVQHWRYWRQVERCDKCGKRRPHAWAWYTRWCLAGIAGWYDLCRRCDRRMDRQAS